MTTCIIAEKPSVARDIARIVGANNKREGYLEGNSYLVTWAIGHLITLAMPEVYGYKEYQRDDLPILSNPHQLVVRQIRKEKEYQDDPSAQATESYSPLLFRGRRNHRRHRCRARRRAYLPLTSITTLVAKSPSKDFGSLR